MKTPIKELEESLKDNLKNIVLNNDYKLIEELFEKALEKEREHLILSYDAGFVNGAFDKPRSPKEYYNKTYNL